jgi:hypothetical protein
MRTKLLFIIALLSTISVLGQNIGDYRSKGAGPVAWNNANSWQVYNGTMWINASNYPGQVAGTYAVVISANHTIDNPNTPNTFGPLTILGTLRLNGNGTPTYNLKASEVAVISPNGRINFVTNCDLVLPASTPLSVSTGGMTVQNPCSAAKRLFIGNILFSTCNGNGPGDPISFEELMNANGTLLSVISAAFADCNSANFNVSLVPGYVGIAGTNTSFQWTIKLPDNSSISSTSNPLVLDLNQQGEYKIDLTYTTTIANGQYTHTRTVTYDNKLTTWNGTWSYGTPTIDTRVIIAGHYTGDSFSSCFLKVNNGASLTINANKYIEVNGSIDNQGTITVENDGSLIQVSDDASFTGNNITIKRTSRPMKRSDYVYWGSPVQENVISQIPTVFDKKFRWQAGASYNWFDLTTATPLPGSGFITRVRNIAPYNVTPTPITFTFIGKPNNGLVTTGVSFVNADENNYGNYNLLANPYPSAISAQKLIEENSSLLTGTLHFWTSVTAYTPETQYSVMDYATWNYSGSSSPPESDPSNNALDPRGFIGTGQGVFVQAKANGTVVFNNRMRELDNNNQFFRMAAPSERSQPINETSEKHRLWLLLSNSSGAFRNMMVGYIEGATNGYEDMYDGVSFTSNNIDFYSILKDKKLVIQGRGLPFDNADEITLGYKAPQAGVYQITLNGTDGMFTKGSIPVYIRDKALNTYHNLRDGAYNFKTQPGTFNDRFELVFAQETPTYDRNDTIENDISAYGADKSIFVSSKELKIKTIEVYDILGKQLFLNNAIDAKEFTTPINTTSNSFLIVKTTLENNSTSTKKIILQ